MRNAIGKIGFYSAACVCNAMVWGMFTVLNMPRIDVVAALPAVVVPIATASVRTALSGKPVRVVVADVGIDVGVAEGRFDPASQEWSLSDDSAYYANSSVPANDNNGTTLIYGHAKPTMFEPLKNATATTRVDIYTDNSMLFTYRFSALREVLPTDTSVFTQSGPPTLVLQTCSGPWDSYRALYSFDYVEVRPV